MPFVAPIPHPGLLVRGTIDIDGRKYPLVFNKDGTISSVFTGSFGVGSQEDTGRIKIPDNIRAKHKSFEICCPGVIHQGGKWKRVGAAAAADFARATGKHLGVFDTSAHADIYAIGLHNYLARFTDAFIKKHRGRVSSRTR